MTKYISNIVSWIFHPVLIPLWGMILIFNSGSYIAHLNWEVKRVILGIIFFATILMPIASISIMYYMQLIKAFDGKHNRDRTLTLAAFSIFYVFAWYLLQKLPISRHIQFLMMNLAGLSIISLLINIKWNISVHMIGLGALAGAIISFTLSRGLNLQVVIMILFIAGGLTGYARLVYDKNTPSQVYAGYLLGFAALFLTGYYL